MKFRGENKSISHTGWLYVGRKKTPLWDLPPIEQKWSLH